VPAVAPPYLVGHQQRAGGIEREAGKALRKFFSGGGKIVDLTPRG
jgi:hypothetical protein